MSVCDHPVARQVLHNRTLEVTGRLHVHVIHRPQAVPTVALGRHRSAWVLSPSLAAVQVRRLPAGDSCPVPLFPSVEVGGLVAARERSPGKHMLQITACCTIFALCNKHVRYLVELCWYSFGSCATAFNVVEAFLPQTASFWLKKCIFTSIRNTALVERRT